MASNMNELQLHLSPSPDKRKYRSRITRKRPRHYFHGTRPNRSRSNEIVPVTDPVTPAAPVLCSTSAKKLRLTMPTVSAESLSDSATSSSSAEESTSEPEESSVDTCDSEPEDNLDGYCVVHLPSIGKCLESSAVCSYCSGQLTITVNATEGIATPLELKCKACSSSSSITLPLASKSRVRDLNVRSVLAARFIGKNYAGLRRFLTVLGLPVAMSKVSYYKYADRLHDAIVEEAKASMQVAAKEVHRHHSEDPSLPAPDDNGIVNATVTCDGTWAKRGFTSLHGVVVVISLTTGQVLDYECLSKSCEACKSWEKKKNTPEFDEWAKQHGGECQANFQGSSGAMECEGAMRMFRRSVTKCNLRYTSVISDGDSKTHTAICEEDVYNGIEVKKLECVGHIQKRMGTGLRKVKKEKKLGGKGKLTDAVIDSMQTYYGKAIREHKGNVRKMQRATLAILYHKLSTDKKPQHKYCPSNSWCKYKNRTGAAPFKHQKPLPAAVGQAILPLFQRLSEKTLLEKCVGGYTQNQNEALNNLIWSFCSKSGYAGAKTIESAVGMAICLFNNGYTAIQRIATRLGISPGRNLTKFLSRLDTDRVKGAERKASQAEQAARKKRRQQRKKKEDRRKAQEGETYVPGGF